MRLDTSHHEFKSNVPMDNVHNVQICGTESMYNILSSQIYTDPMLAMVRELSANALDAHIANGNADEPFEITLPHAMHSVFAVRDFGTGLSDDDILSLYLTYGASNKGQTNSLVGGLGLGSKTPFAYTDQFTCTSYFNGTATLFQIFKDDHGIPKVIQLEKKPTDERNGLDIRIAIKDSDVTKLHDTAAQALTHFPVKPILNGAQINLKYPKYGCPIIDLNNPLDNEPHIVIDNPFDINGDPIIYVEKAKERYEYRTKGEIIMGPISYGYGTTPTDLCSAARDLFAKDGYLIAPIGTFSIAASRETINYNKQTIARLNTLSRLVIERVEKDITEKREAITSIKDVADLHVYLCKSRMVTNVKKVTDLKDAHIYNFNGWKFDLHTNHFVNDLNKYLNTLFPLNKGRMITKQSSKPYAQGIWSCLINTSMYLNKTKKPKICILPKPNIPFMHLNKDIDHDLFVQYLDPADKSTLETVLKVLDWELPEEIEYIKKERTSTGNKLVTTRKYSAQIGKHHCECKPHEVINSDILFIKLDSTSGPISVIDEIERWTGLTRDEILIRKTVNVITVPQNHTRVINYLKKHGGVIYNNIEDLKPFLNMNSIKHKYLMSIFASYASSFDPFHTPLKKYNAKSPFLIELQDMFAQIEKLGKQFPYYYSGWQSFYNISDLLKSFCGNTHFTNFVQEKHLPIAHQNLFRKFNRAINRMERKIPGLKQLMQSRHSPWDISEKAMFTMIDKLFK